MNHFQKLTLAVILVAACHVVVPGISAAQVYKWTDNSGITHFSSSKPHENAKPADLPPIMREKVKEIASTGEICKAHGGINCEEGPDTDGSVICYDGYRETPERFQFRCKSAKITISDISNSTSDHEGEFSIWIRNEKDVEAQDVLVELLNPDGTNLVAEGPQAIAPLEMAEYKLKNIDATQTPSKAQIEATCANCG